MAREQVQFTEVDMDTLTKEQRDAWEYYLEAKRLLGEHLNTSAPQGKKIVFTTKYNVLKVGMVTKASGKSKGPKVDLGAWQAQRTMDGLGN